MYASFVRFYYYYTFIDCSKIIYFMLSSTNRKEKMFNVRRIYMKLSPLQLKSDKPRHKVLDSHL